MKGPGFYRDFFMDYGEGDVYIKSSAMLLFSCLIVAINNFSADTTKKEPARPANTKESSKVISVDSEDGFYCGFTEAWPSFPGGEEALTAYLKKNVKYPVAALNAKMSGTIFMQFIVSQEGIIREVHPLGPYKGYGMEAEAIRVVCNMPKWKPARMEGRPTDVLFNLPIRFVYPPQKANKKSSPH